MSDILVLKIQKLIDSGVGDIARLLHIKEVIETGNVFYNSDKKYLDDLILKYIDTTYQSKKIIQTSQQKQEKQYIPQMKKSKSKIVSNVSQEDVSSPNQSKHEIPDVSLTHSSIPIEKEKKSKQEKSTIQNIELKHGKRFAILQLNFGLFVVAGGILIIFGLFLLATLISLDLWMNSVFISTSSVEIAAENLEQTHKMISHIITPFIIISTGFLVVGVLTVLIGYQTAKNRIKKYKE